MPRKRIDCNWCSQENKSTAKKCEFCGNDLEENVSIKTLYEDKRYRGRLQS